MVVVRTLKYGLIPANLYKHISVSIPWGKSPYGCKGLGKYETKIKTKQGARLAINKWTWPVNSSSLKFFVMSYGEVEI